MIGYPKAARYATAIREITGDEEIVPPGFILESDRFEHSFNKMERLFGRTTTSGAVAGQFSFIVLRQRILPAGALPDDQILVLRAVVVSAGNALIGLDDGPTGTGFAQGFTLDARFLTSAGAMANSSGGLLVGAQVASLGRSAFLIPPSIYTPFQAVLANNRDQIVLMGTVVNTAITAGFIWAERSATRDELAVS